MSTFTASQWASQPKGHHVGLQAVTGVLDIAVTATASSIFKMVQVPNQASIVDMVLYLVDAGANQTHKLGIVLPHSDTTTVTPSALTSDLSSTGGIVHRGGSKFPYKVSLSDNAWSQVAWVQLESSAAISASAQYKLTLFYTMDND